jgi:SOS-response transcriptional repressor LexA
MNLSRQQMHVCEFVTRYYVKHGVSPTFAEVADEMGISRTTAYLHVQAAIEKGALERASCGNSRQLQVTEAFVDAQRQRSAIAEAMARVRHDHATTVQ